MWRETLFRKVKCPAWEALFHPAVVYSCVVLASADRDQGSAWENASLLVANGMPWDIF